MKKIVLLILILILLPIRTYADETMQATVTAHYQHPVTGNIEDSGNNIEIGQGMTQNILDSKSLVEMINDQLYATVRLNMANHISNITLSVQERGQNVFSQVNYEVIDKTEETVDLKFTIPSKTAIVRVSFFVDPMGRDVIFYFDFSNFKTLSGSSSRSQENQSQINTQKNQVNTNENLDKSASPDIQISDDIQNEDLQTAISSPNERQITINLEDEISKSDSHNQNSNNNKETQSLSSENIGYDHGLLMKDSKQLQNYYNIKDNKQTNTDSPNNQNIKNKEKALKQNAPMGEFTKFILKVTIAFIFVIATVLFIIAVIMIIIAKVLRQINLREEEKLYD